MGCLRSNEDGVQAENDVVAVEQDFSEQISPYIVKAVSERKMTSKRISALSAIKFTLSTMLLILSIVIAMALIGTRQTQVSQSLHPGVTIFLFWFVLIWMAALEGSQTSLVGLVPVDKSRYGDSHPFAWISTNWIHKDGNLERFIVGRQFLVVLAVFVTNLLGGTIVGANIAGLPDIINAIFVKSGIALMLVTVMFGQLMAQVNASRCMLDTINNYFALYVVSHFSMAVEASGLLHATYLVQILFSKLSGKKESLEEPTTKRTLVQQFFFWARVAFSCAILGLAFAYILVAIVAGKTTMWKGAPSFLSVILLFLLMIFAGMLEGMQIAILAVSKLPEEALANHAIAKKNRDLVLQGDNLQAFFIGRQMLVTASMFVVARITGMAVVIGQGENIFNVSDQVQETLFNSNILAAILTTIVSSLIWRVIASTSPIPFLSSRVINVIIRSCLIAEASGLCSAASLLSKMQSVVCRFKSDEEYLRVEEAIERDLEHQQTKDSLESFDTVRTVSDLAPPSADSTTKVESKDDDEFSVAST